MQGTPALEEHADTGLTTWQGEQEPGGLRLTVTRVGRKEYQVVSWPRGEEVVVRRTWQEFVLLHRTLEARYAGGWGEMVSRYRREGRVVPPLPAKLTYPRQGISHMLLLLQKGKVPGRPEEGEVFLSTLVRSKTWSCVAR